MTRSRCKGKRPDGSQCQAYPVRGALVCSVHGGRAPQVAAKAKVRAELQSWGLDAPTVDPGETLLRLVSQSAARAERYARELFDKLADDEDGALRKALVADVWIVDLEGEAHKAGEYVRALAKLEADERDRCANFCRIAIAAGLAERQVRLAERQGQMIAEVLRTVMGDPELGLSEAQKAALPAVARRALAG
jgi:hypothetical protein